jgi:hypothetical protein
MNKIKIFWYRLLKKQYCWDHNSFTKSCPFCKEIVA